MTILHRDAVAMRPRAIVNVERHPGTRAGRNTGRSRVDHALQTRAPMLTKGLLCTLLLTACTATTISPPLTARGSPDPRHTFDRVHLTSGAFAEPHRVIGVIQLTQTGYKWLHEIELQDDARPESLLFNIGRYARSLGADGVQHLRVVDLDPQTPADTAGKKINSVVNIHNAIERKDYASIAADGTKTRWEVRGELVQFLPPQGAQNP